MKIHRINTGHHTYTIVQTTNKLMQGRIIHKYKGKPEVYRYLKWIQLIGMEKQFIVNHERILTDKIALINYYL